MNEDFYELVENAIDAAFEKDVFLKYCSSFY